MLALGGQGGGVLTGWLVETAEANGYIAQSTYVAGVAQRTGATVYCVEMFPADKAALAGRPPVFTSYPIPGDVELVIAGEMAEMGRAIQKGFVTPNVTTLIASSHRVYSMPEKEALGDGIMDLTKVVEIARRAAKKLICFDMQAAADETGSIISSVLLGAIAASGALPFPRAAFEDVIRKSGKAVEANLRGFAAGFDGDHAPTIAAEPAQPAAAVPLGRNGEALAARIRDTIPAPAQDLALHGALRALDYQDVDYANHYLDLLHDIVRLDRDNGGSQREFALSAEVARQLALQMCYEDTIRVADLKTRGDRFERIRRQVAALPGQPVRVVEYFHPRFEEFVDTLPAGVGAYILRSDRMRKMLSIFFGRGRNVTTTSVSGFLLLHTLAKLRRFRRGSYRFAKQQSLISDWLERVTLALRDNYDDALSIANCIEIVKGYGDTYERGLARYSATIEFAATLAPGNRGDAVRQLHRAALADEKGRVFSDTLSKLETAA